MMRAMVHRGPDDEGFEQRPLGDADTATAVAGFGFRRLAILDLSPAGHQPMVNPATGDCLIFNGEIYNFRSLQTRLHAEGIEVRSSGDTEVLLKALSLWGERALEHLDGMFAFAFYEARSRRILLARDHIGIKPLYFAHSSAGSAPAFVFASEVRAILASGLVSDDLDPAGVASFLAYGAPQDPLTIHRAIRSFPSGSCCWIDADVATSRRSVAPRRYWHFPSAISTAVESAAVSSLRACIDGAIREQSMADVPVAAFLSGGIDSGMISALAKRSMPGLRTHAVGFKSHSIADELAPAAATAQAIGTLHSQTILDDSQIGQRWQEWLTAADRPSIDGLNTFVVSRAVKDAGATVALSGLGADELFGGYSLFRSVPGLYRWLRPCVGFPPGLRRLAARMAFAALRPSRRERAIDLVTHCHSPLDVLLRMRRVFGDNDLAAIGMRAADVGLAPPFLPPEEYSLLRDSMTADTFHMISQAECRLYLGNTVLRDADVNSMAHSLEVRVPFLSRRLVEEAACLPGRMHMPARGRPKHLLRMIGRDLLPKDVFLRPKQGFSLPLGDWVFGSLRERSEAAVEAVAACHLFDSVAVRSQWRWLVDNRHRTGWNRGLSLVVLGSYLQQLSKPAAQGSSERPAVLLPS